MLYDPKWEVKVTKARPYSWASIIGWLESHPAHEEYRYVDPHDCLHAQYREHIGRWRFINPLQAILFHPVMEFKIAMQKPRTFGAALRRARRLAGVM